MKIDLSKDSGYLIAAAIRGPDIKDGAFGTSYQAFSDVKRVFTARFRHICGVAYFGAEIRMGANPTTLHDDESTSMDQFCDTITSFAKAGSAAEKEAMWHVLSHLKRAFNVLPEDERAQYKREITALVNLIDSVSRMLDYFPTDGGDAAAWVRAAYANLVGVIHFTDDNES